MRILIYLPFLLIAAWNNPVQAQWADARNPTGLPQHLFKPVDVAAGAGWNSHGQMDGFGAVRNPVAENLFGQNGLSRQKWPEVYVQVRRKIRKAAGIEWCAPEPA